MAIDLGSIDLKAEGEEGSFCHLYDPHTGEYFYDGEEEVGIFTKGAHSYTARNIISNLNKRSQAKKTPKKDFDIDKMEEENAQYLSKLAIGWQAIEFNGESKFTQALVFELYKDRPWVMEQVTKHIGDASNFTKRS